jgi:hypothetical protein
MSRSSEAAMGVLAAVLVFWASVLLLLWRFDQRH